MSCMASTRAGRFAPSARACGSRAIAIAMVDRAFVKLREAGAWPDADLLALMRDVQVPLWLARESFGDTGA